MARFLDLRIIFFTFYSSPSLPTPTLEVGARVKQEKYRRRKTGLERAPKSKQQNSNSCISKPAQIRLKDHRSQMEIVILLVFAVQTHVVGLVRSQRKQGSSFSMS